MRSAVQPKYPIRRSSSGWRRALGLLGLATVVGVALLADRIASRPPARVGATAPEPCDPTLACGVPSAPPARAAPRPDLPTADPGRTVAALLTAVHEVEAAEGAGTMLDPAQPAALGALAREAGPLALSRDPVATWPRKGPAHPEAIPLGALITGGAGDVSYGEKPEPVLASAPAVASARLP